MAKRKTIRKTNPPGSAATVSAQAQPKAGRPFAPGYGIVGPKDGKGLPWSWVTKKMGACHTFWVATIRNSPSGAGSALRGPRPHVMPVWGVWLDDSFCFSTGRKSRKGQNLAANPACTVTNDDGEEAVIVEGRAEEVKASAALERVAHAYKRKYKMDPRSMGEPIFTVRPNRVFAFIEKSFPHSATRWTLEHRP